MKRTTIFAVVCSLLSLHCADSAPREVVPAKAASSPPAKPSTPPPPADDTSTAAEPAPESCGLSMKMGKITPSDPECTLNEQVSNTAAELTYDCDTGDAEVTFGTQTFKGTVVNGTVDLSVIEPFKYMGCPFESLQTFKGKIATGKLSYAYTERRQSTCLGVNVPQVELCTGAGAATVTTP